MQYFALLPIYLDELKLNQDLIKIYSQGLTDSEVKESRKIFGENLIEVEVPSWKSLFL